MLIPAARPKRKLWITSAPATSIRSQGVSLFRDTSGAGDIHLGISRFAILASTLLLETVGLVAGLLPAIKAARLDPNEALHYE